MLGVSRALLSMAQSGSRGLPLEARARAQRLHEALEPAPAPDGPAAGPPPAPEPSAPAPPLFSSDERWDLDLRRRGLALQAQAVRDQLARKQTRLAQARLRQQVLPGLRATLPPSDKAVQITFDYLERQAALDLETEAGPAALLALRLAVLNFEAAGIGRLLGEAPAAAPGLTLPRADAPRN